MCIQKVLTNRCQNIDPPYRKMVSYPHVLYHWLSNFATRSIENDVFSLTFLFLNQLNSNLVQGLRIGC